MAFRAAESRPYAAEVHRVTSESVALQAEAQTLRERKLALEEAMRQERSRRLQHAAQKKTAAHPNSASGASPDGVKESPARSEPPPHESRSRSGSHAPPQDLNEYRRELDSANGNKEVYRLHYYTSGHIDPADVHFYTAKGRVKEYQRRAPSPPEPRTTSRRADARVGGSDSAHLLAIMPPPADIAAEQTWTKSALLRMEANKRVLKRIHDHEKREAAIAAANHRRSTTSSSTGGGNRSTSARRTQPPLVVDAQELSTTQTSAPRSVTPRVGDAVVTGAAPVAAAVPPPPPPSLPYPQRQEYSWRRGENATIKSAPALVPRWSPPRHRSPPRSYFNSSPLHLSSGAGFSRLEGQNSPFKPSLTYSSSSASMHASRFESHTVPSSVERRVTSPWRPLQDSVVMPSSGVRGAYQPIAPQVAATSSTPWESRRAWEAIRLNTSPSAVAGATPQSASAVKGTKAEVEVSPLTPSPTLRTARRSAGEKAGDVVEATADVEPAQPRRSLLDGFRMPETVLRRDDLFQGTA